MSYTLGALHGAVSGTGSMALASPAGLLLRLTTIPASITQTFGTPPRLFNAGDVALGDANGWCDPIPLTTADLLKPRLELAPTLLAYNLTAGVVLVVRELVDVPASTVREQPWDRSPVYVSQFAAPQAGPSGFVTMWTYTVPSGRKLHVSSGDVAVSRITAATTPSVCSVYLFANGSGFHSLHAWSNTVGDRQSAPLAPDGMTFEAGTVISAGYQDFSAGGTRQISAELQGYTFLA